MLFDVKLGVVGACGSCFYLLAALSKSVFMGAMRSGLRLNIRTEVREQQMYLTVHYCADPHAFERGCIDAISGNINTETHTAIITVNYWDTINNTAKISLEYFLFGVRYLHYPVIEYLENDCRI